MSERNLPMREALRSALREEMLRDENVFVMGEEVGLWQGTHRVTNGLLEEFGAKRVRDTPISEMVIAGAAVGAAMAGLRPVAEIMTINFAFLSLDASGWGNQATATHSHTPEPIFAHFPGLYVACPSTPADAKGMLKASIRDDNPVLFTESIALYPKPGPVPDDENFVLPIGKSDVKREGKHVTIVTYARGVEWSLRAADELAKDGVECEVIDLRWLRPLDMEAVFTSFKKTNRCVVVEESLPHFSVGSEVAAQIQENCFDYMDAPIRRVSSMDVPLPYARDIELMALPDTQKVINAVKEII